MVRADYDWSTRIMTTQAPLIVSKNSSLTNPLEKKISAKLLEKVIASLTKLVGKMVLRSCHV